MMASALALQSPAKGSVCSHSLHPRLETAKPQLYPKEGLLNTLPASAFTRSARCVSPGGGYGCRHASVLQIIKPYVRFGSDIKNKRGIEVHAVSGKSGEGAAWGQWKEVTDPVTGQAYYWDTLTNETTWNKPSGWGTTSAVSNSQAPATISAVSSNKVADDELMDILLTAAEQDADRFGSVANKHRPRVFEDGFFDHITQRIGSAPDADTRERLEKLRAKLANPLLKNAPPY